MFDDQSTGKFTSGQTKHFLKKDKDWEKYVPKKDTSHMDESHYYTMQSMDEAAWEKEMADHPGMGQIRQDLKHQLGSWLVDNRDKIMAHQMKLMDEKYGRDDIDGKIAS